MSEFIVIAFSQSQIDALVAQKLEKFQNRMLQRARMTCPERLQGFDDVFLLECIARGIQVAECFGIEDEEDVEWFLVFSIDHGLNFDRFPNAVMNILSNPSVDGKEKIARIAEQKLRN